MIFAKKIILSAFIYQIEVNASELSVLHPNRVKKLFQATSGL
jgi:hypothetical protein